MHFWFDGDGNGFELHIQVDWKAIIALLKAALATLIVLVSLLAAFGRLGI